VAEQLGGGMNRSPEKKQCR